MRICVCSFSDRDVARIAVVDEAENVFYDQYVKPDKPIMSYLTQLTGITERYCIHILHGKWCAK